MKPGTGGSRARAPRAGHGPGPGARRPPVERVSVCVIVHTAGPVRHAGGPPRTACAGTATIPAVARHTERRAAPAVRPSVWAQRDTRAGRAIDASRNPFMAPHLRDPAVESAPADRPHNEERRSWRSHNLATSNCGVDEMK